MGRRGDQIDRERSDSRAAGSPAGEINTRSFSEGNPGLEAVVGQSTLFRLSDCGRGHNFFT